MLGSALLKKSAEAVSDAALLTGLTMSRPNGRAPDCVLSVDWAEPVIVEIP